MSGFSRTVEILCGPAANLDSTVNHFLNQWPEEHITGKFPCILNGTPASELQSRIA